MRYVQLASVAGWVVIFACATEDGGPSDPSNGAADASIPDSMPVDAGVQPTSEYGYIEPPASQAPDIFEPARWLGHLEQDLLPYWTMEAARGEPVGNFPTHRTMTGAVASPTERWPRMLSRQTYAYAMGYAMTGDPELLRLAKAGADYIMENVPDPQGGFHPRLAEDGSPVAEDEKWAQDAAYVMLGLGAYFFVTRDADVEAALVAGRDLLFDPNTYWDADNQRIRDGMRRDFSGPADQFDDDGYELVAQLDPINAFMLLVQPLLSEQSRRQQFLDDLQTLSQTMIDTFWEDGIFWGIHNQKGNYRSRHVDFGHTLKAYWMILQVDKRLEGNPFHDFLDQNAPQWVERAYSPDRGRWGKRPQQNGGVDWSSDWWIWAEEDQIAATLTLGGELFDDELENTAAYWLDNYVDDRAAGEVVPGLNDRGQPYGWSDSATDKCFRWKNGYHSVEHALVMYLFSSWRTGLPAELHFAVPADRTEDFEAVPYFFDGTETGREASAPIQVDDVMLTPVKVQFSELY